MRKFEKISFENFKSEIKDDINLYNSYSIPTRDTKHSAGYDFKSVIDFTIKPNESLMIPTGIKVCMNEDEVLLLIERSSMGFKYNLRMCNQVGVIDSDYYNSKGSEGHIWIKLKNEGNNDYVVKIGDKIVQGLFMKFLKTDEENEIEKERTSLEWKFNKNGEDKDGK